MVLVDLSRVLFSLPTENTPWRWLA